MPRDTWRNARKRPVPDSGAGYCEPETEAERAAFFIANAQELRQSERDFAKFMKEEREREPARKKRKRRKAR